jgi:hypothetical protein
MKRRLNFIEDLPLQICASGMTYHWAFFKANQESVVASSSPLIYLTKRIGAFSNEVATGSREENASNKGVEPPFRFNRNGKGSKQSESCDEKLFPV